MKTDITLLKKLSFQKDVLIIEDDVEITKGLLQLLGRFFKKTFTAINTTEALKVYKELDKPLNLLIITDINLGGQSGIDFTCTIKNINPQQRVIAISATKDRGVFIDSIECGVDRFVLKPINKDILFNAIIEVLKKIDYDRELEENKQLLQESRQYVIKLLEEQDQFLKNAIHEIHTPLAVIIANIDLLRMDGIEHNSLNAIEAGSRTIQNSYEDMTYLMRKDQHVENKEEINLIEFIRDRHSYFECIAQANSLAILISIEQDKLSNIAFYESKLLRLVDNTLSNAIKYSYRSSTIYIIVGIQNNEQFFEIRNKGPLILDKKKIFHRFHRESYNKGGYGLGLSIVKQICDEENINISIKSTDEEGTSFKYTFKNAT